MEFISQVKEAALRIEKDFEELEQRLKTAQSESWPTGEDDSEKQLKSSAQLLVDVSVAMVSMIVLKQKVNRVYDEKGMFSFHATLKEIQSHLSEHIGNLRSVLYALQERSRSIREIHGIYAQSKGSVDTGD